MPQHRFHYFLLCGTVVFGNIRHFFPRCNSVGDCIGSNTQSGNA